MTELKRHPCKLEIDQDLCVGCGECTKVCPSGVLRISETTGKATVLKEGLCCGHCFAVCPVGAIKIGDTSASDVPEAPTTSPVAYSDLVSLLRERRAVRRFQKGRKIPRDELDAILADCRYAPTACNNMDVAYAVVDDAATLDAVRALTLEALAGVPKFARLAKAISKDASCICGGEQLLVVEAPMVPPFCDGTIAMENFEVLAQTKGIRTCWAGFVSIALQVSPKLREFLREKGAARGPDGSYAYYAMMIGYPDEKYVRVPPRPNPPVLWI